jgi:hypothetical protein
VLWLIQPTTDSPENCVLRAAVCYDLSDSLILVILFDVVDVEVAIILGRAVWVAREVSANGKVYDKKKRIIAVEFPSAAAAL